MDCDINDTEFALFQSFIFDHAGISLSSRKKTLVSSRLNKRLRHYNLSSFQQYYDIVMSSPADGERQVATDLLTTNETYFFREPKHFDFLKDQVLQSWPRGKPMKIWSAASSTGEEVYSLSMLLDDQLNSSRWDIFGSDISHRVLETASRGLYQQLRIEGIPQAYLKKYCLKGTGEHEGLLLIANELRQRVRFAQINLQRPLPNLGSFDVIFLRNVLIYFNDETKKIVIKKIVDKLRPGGYLFIGHSESIRSFQLGLNLVTPAVYQKL
ncbi:MAG: SAM-dependent methyltransferase [Alteromonadaceae bacterium]|nr:MAG: SAM-dependent methyltransferase [Alteromonadaceae bacterium]